MVKDKRYNTVKNLILSGHISLFREIFDTLPKSVLYRDLGMNNERFNSLMNSVDLFLIKDLFRISNLIGIDEKKMLEIVLNQYLKDKKNTIAD